MPQLPKSKIQGTPPLLADALPEFAAELAALLRKAGYDNLAAEVPFITITSRCPCGDSFCATMYVHSRQIERVEDMNGVDLDTEKGMVVLDVVEGRITCIEVLNRDDVRCSLLELLP